MSIKWLHLSDFHIGKNEYAQRELLEEICNHVAYNAENGVPDFVFFTGDIAQSGQRDQYDKFNEFLAQLKIALNVEKNSNIRFFFVPGNHDVDRDNLPPYDRRSVLNCSDTFTPTELGAKKRKLAVLSGVESYCDAFDAQWVATKGYNVEKCQINGELVAIVQINTAWLSKDDSDRGYLTPGYELVKTALKECTECSVKMVLGHHPTSEFSDEESYAVERLFRENNIIYLHGHLHKGRVTQNKTNDANWFIPLQAGSAFQSLPSDSTNWFNGFCWGELDLSKLEITITPYRRENDNWVPDNDWPMELRVDNSNKFKIAIPSLTKQPAAISKQGNCNPVELAPVDKVINWINENLDFQKQSPVPKVDKETSLHTKRIIFWPVRARQPTLIHALQAFTAAAFQKAGAEVHLYIDDLNPNINECQETEELISFIDHWFDSVDTKFSLVNCTKLSEMEDEDHHNETWLDIIRTWFAIQDLYNLEQLLEISKLLGNEESRAEIFPSDKYARKLLAPTLIWTGLNRLVKNDKDAVYYTLGGHDEEKLWEAFRRSLKIKDVRIGHIYNPKVVKYTEGDDEAQRLSLDDIYWTTEIRIRTEFKKLLSYDSNRNLRKNNSLLRVAYKACIELPAYILEQKVESWNEFLEKNDTLSNDDFAQTLAKTISKKYLR